MKKGKEEPGRQIKRKGERKGLRNIRVAVNSTNGLKRRPKRRKKEGGAIGWGTPQKGGTTKDRNPIAGRGRCPDQHCLFRKKKEVVKRSNGGLRKCFCPSLRRGSKQTCGASQQTGDVRKEKRKMEKRGPAGKREREGGRITSSSDTFGNFGRIEEKRGGKQKKKGGGEGAGRSEIQEDKSRCTTQTEKEGEEHGQHIVLWGPRKNQLKGEKDDQK